MSIKHTIGITGGIGSGKSIVSRVLRCNGFPVYDCDSEAKKIMESENEVKTKLKSLFGTELYSESGKLNRKFLANHLFNDFKIRTVVNEIVHRAVYLDIEKKLSESKKEFFIESAILYSSGLWQLCEEIWIVEASEDEKVRRVSKRDNLSLKDILIRMKIQVKEFSDLIKKLTEEKPLSPQNKFELRGRKKLIILENDNNEPILLRVLELSKEEIINQQTYHISC